MPAKGSLMLQKAFEFFRFSIREKQRIVLNQIPPITAPGPGAAISAKATWPTLDLHQIDFVKRNNEEIDLVDAAVIGYELEIRPGAKRLGIRKFFPKVREGLPLPWILGFRHLYPSTDLHCFTCFLSNSSVL